MGVPQTKVDKMHKIGANKPNGVFGYNGEYYYAIKNGQLVLIGDRISGETWAVSGAFLVERKTQLRKDLKAALVRSI